MSEQATIPGWPDEPPHLLIRASAGSGKTYRLSSRYLRLLRYGASPTSILATTFTRKAAGEVLGRVITRLAEAIDDPGKRSELAAATGGGELTQAQCLTMLRSLADALHRLSVVTIDGFFNRVARTFAFELDLPPDPLIVDESHPVVARLREQAIEAMLGEAADQDDIPGLVTLLRQFHHDHAARSVTQALDEIITKTYEIYREAPDSEVWAVLEPGNSLNADELKQAIKRLEEAVENLPDNKNWHKGFHSNLSAAKKHNWEAFLNSGLAKALAKGETTYYRKDIPKPLVKVFRPLVDHARVELIRRVANQTRATFDLLSRFHRHYTRLRRQHGVLLFSDLTHKLARELPGLGEGVWEDLYYRIDGRVKHLLLDEFQDTSLAQWAFLSPIAQETRASAEGDRSMLIVGDAKQAIYGWRGGVAELFDTVEKELQLEPENIQSLAHSYRSSQVVLDTVNRVFSGLSSCPSLLENDEQTAKRWEGHFETHSAIKDIPGYVRLETSPAEPDSEQAGSDESDTDEDADLPSSHARFVAERVHELYDRPGGAGSIGVLVRTNKAASRLIYEIGQLGVPVSGEGGGSLLDSPAVLAMLSALKMADHPGDTASAFHVFNSPLGRVVGLQSLEPNDRKDTALHIRQKLISRGYAQTLADWTQAVASDCDARGLTRLTQLIELAETFDVSDGLRPGRFVQLAESASVTEPSPADVRVMTIHGSKGLEFDTVVLGELDKGFNFETPLMVERSGPTEPIIGVYRYAAEEIRKLHSRYEQAYQHHRATRLMDDLCALYVAMTRARQGLYMIVRPRKENKKGLRKRSLSFGSILCDALCEIEEHPRGNQLLYEHGNPDWACQASMKEMPEETEARVEPIELASTEDQPRRFRPMVSPSSKAGGVRQAQDLLDIATDSHDARRYGTMIHAWMEQIGYLDEDGKPDENRLREIALKIRPGESDDWLNERVAWFGRLLDGDTAQQMLTRRGASTVWREKNFAVWDGNELMRGCFDRVTIFTDDTGRTVRAELLDFKTDRVEEGDTAALVEHYQPQIRAYARGLSKLLNIPITAIEARLWFVGTDQLADVPI